MKRLLASVRSASTGLAAPRSGQHAKPGWLARAFNATPGEGS